MSCAKQLDARSRMTAMPNDFITPEQLASEFIEVIERVSGGDKKVMREILYDWQTSVGGFPENEAERKAYIEATV
jgi:hypothetical protein